MGKKVLKIPKTNVENPFAMWFSVNNHTPPAGNGWMNTRTLRFQLLNTFFNRSVTGYKLGVNYDQLNFKSGLCITLSHDHLRYKLCQPTTRVIVRQRKRATRVSVRQRSRPPAKADACDASARVKFIAPGRAARTSFFLGFLQNFSDIVVFRLKLKNTDTSLVPITHGNHPVRIRRYVRQHTTTVHNPALINSVLTNTIWTIGESKEGHVISMCQEGVLGKTNADSATRYLLQSEITPAHYSGQMLSSSRSTTPAPRHRTKQHNAAHISPHLLHTI